MPPVKPRTLPKTKETAILPPDLGSALSQLFNVREVRGEVIELIGEFNPRYVNTETRLMMRLDPVVAFGLAIVCAPIINVRWGVESKDEDIRAFVREEMRKRYFDLASAATVAIEMGFQVLEKVWKIDDVTVQVEDDVEGGATDQKLPNSWVYDEFKPIDPRTISLLVDKKDRFAGVEQFGSSTEREAGKGTRVSADKVVLWSFRKQKIWGKLTGWPLLNQAYKPWWSKIATELFCNRYFERKADPAVKARTEAEITLSGGRKTDGFGYMGNALLTLKNGGNLLLPNHRDSMGNHRFDAEYFQDDKRGDMFQQRLDGLDVQILRSLWITDRAGTTSTMGSEAMATVHAETMSGSLEMIFTEWMQVLNSQVIDPLVILNFGIDRWKESKTRIIGTGLSSGMKSILKDLIVALIQAEQAAIDGDTRVRVLDRLDAADMIEQLGLPMHTPEEMLKIIEKKKEAAEEARQAMMDLAEETGPTTPGQEDAVNKDLIKKGVKDGNKGGNPKKPTPATGKKQR